MLRKLLARKWLWVILLLVILGGAGGIYAYRVYGSSAEQESSEAQMQTAVARRGDLVIYASGAGQVVPASEINLAFDESGTLIELNVAEGDVVKAGDVLARLQTKDTPETIQASITEAELAVIKAQQALDDLYTNAEISRTTAMNDIATYAQEVRDAQYQLENYSMPLYLQGMDAITAVDQMKEKLDAASAAFEPYRYYAADNATRRSLLVALNEAQSSYDAAVKRLNYEYQLAVAQANLEKARQEYEAYKDGPAADDLSLAEAELANAKANLALAQDAQAVLDLKAPMDGTVMSVDASVGENVATTAFITLADLKQKMLEVYLDETDLDKVAVGNAVEVSFDALPDQVFTGKVTSVGPALETVSNFQAVKALVLLDDESQAAGSALPVGLNATVDVISGRATNAVLVPIEALRDLGDGEYAVFVVENGQPALRVVEVGLMDITYAEIISGIEEGEVVTTGIQEVQ